MAFWVSSSRHIRIYTADTPFLSFIVDLNTITPLLTVKTPSQAPEIHQRPVRQSLFPRQEAMPTIPCFSSLETCMEDEWTWLVYSADTLIQSNSATFAGFLFLKRG
jgi:hypothetical protein